MVSICNLCGQCDEIEIHLFLQCLFAIKIWSWLHNKFNCALDLYSFASLLSICDRKWSTQLRDISFAAITNTVWVL